MKSLIVLVVGLLAVGCGQTKLQQEALRDSVIGEYQSDGKDGYTYTYFFLENGVCFESRISHGVTAIGDGTVGLAIEGGSSRMENNKWSIENKEIHF